MVTKRLVKDALLHCKRRPFTHQKMPFCNAIHALLQCKRACIVLPTIISFYNRHPPSPLDQFLSVIRARLFKVFIVPLCHRRHRLTDTPENPLSLSKEYDSLRTTRIYHPENSPRFPLPQPLITKRKTTKIKGKAQSSKS